MQYTDVSLLKKWLFFDENIIQCGSSKVYWHSMFWANTVKPVLSGHSKIDKMKVLKTDGSLMQVFCLLLSGRLRQVWLYKKMMFTPVYPNFTI